MIRKVLTLALLTTVATTAQAKPKQTGEEQLAEMLKGRVAGKPVDCINMPNVWSSVVIDKTAIVYESGSTYYVQRPKVGSDSLDSDDVLVTKLTTSELCSIDTIQLHDRTTGSWRGFLSLDKFVPYERAPKEATAQ